MKYTHGPWTVVVLETPEFLTFEPNVSFGTTWRNNQECESFLLFRKNSDFCLTAIYLFNDGSFYSENYAPLFLQAIPAEMTVLVGVFKPDAVK